MYGPPADPRQLLAPAELLASPGRWALCLGLGLGLLLLAWRARGWREAPRVLLAMAGVVLLATAPLAAMLNDVVYGAWPSTDKVGSYLFYLDGVHRRLLSQPLQATDDPALRLIGAHVGHLWVTEFFDLFLNTHGAFNVQAIFYPLLAWFCAWLLMRELGSDPLAAMLAAFPFGLGLHVFRDLQWATVEKSAVFGLPMFAWLLLRARARGGTHLAWAALAFAATAWLNWYLALLNGTLLLVYLLWARNRRATLLGLGSLLACLPLLVLQLELFQGAGALADPQRFLWERAALDVLSIWPPRWNHLELWRSLNLACLALGLWGIWTQRRDRRILLGTLLAAGLAILSMGPLLWGSRQHGLPNPLCWLAWTTIPGFWRVAKPEFFLEGSYLFLLVMAALQLSRLRLAPRTMFLLGLLFVIGWLLSVRTHPAFPVFTLPSEVRLSPGWSDHVFGNENG